MSLTSRGIYDGEVPKSVEGQTITGYEVFRCSLVEDYNRGALEFGLSRRHHSSDSSVFTAPHEEAISADAVIGIDFQWIETRLADTEAFFGDGLELVGNVSLLTQS